METSLIIEISSLPCIDDKRGRYRTIELYPKISGIYKITSPNGSIYIGLSNDIYYRIYSCYKKLRCKAQHKIYNSLIKYGIDNHKFEIIHIVENFEEYEKIKILRKLEIAYIQKYNSFYGNNNFGMNLTKGGEIIELTDETKKIMNDKKKGRIVSQETREKLRKINLGKKLSQEHKDKISISHKGKIVSELTKKRLSESHKGEKHSFERIQKKIGSKQNPETIKKRIDKISGINHWTKKYGGHSEQTKIKISISLKERHKKMSNKNEKNTN
jgi:group I intron endonuclease